MGVGDITVNRAWLSKSKVIPKHGQVALLPKSSRTRKRVPPSSEQKNRTLSTWKNSYFQLHKIHTSINHITRICQVV